VDDIYDTDRNIAALWNRCRYVWRVSVLLYICTSTCLVYFYVLLIFDLKTFLASMPTNFSHWVVCVKSKFTVIKSFRIPMRPYFLLAYLAPSASHPYSVDTPDLPRNNKAFSSKPPDFIMLLMWPIKQSIYVCGVRPSQQRSRMATSLSSKTLSCRRTASLWPDCVSKRGAGACIWYAPPKKKIVAPVVLGVKKSKKWTNKSAKKLKRGRLG